MIRDARFVDHELAHREGARLAGLPRRKRHTHGALLRSHIARGIVDLAQNLEVCVIGVREEHLEAAAVIDRLGELDVDRLADSVLRVGPGSRDPSARSRLVRIRTRFREIAGGRTRHHDVGARGGNERKGDCAHCDRNETTGHRSSLRANSAMRQKDRCGWKIRSISIAAFFAEPNGALRRTGHSATFGIEKAEW